MGNGDPSCLVSDGSAIYTATASHIVKIPLDGSPYSAVLANMDRSRCVAVDAQYLYWTNDLKGTISKIAK